ncbi:hypothetical protein BS028_08815 [Vibrio parahaemolyticus]|nr:hypothetical protein [Vibrio parahaemolyticus]
MKLNAVSVKNLASSRALIAVMFNLDKIEKNRLTLPKKVITNGWTESASSRRDIAKNAKELADIKIIQVESCQDMYDSPEDLEVQTLPIFKKIDADTYNVSFEFEAENLSQFKKLSALITSKYEQKDFLEFKSKFSLGLLLACLQVIKSRKINTLFHCEMRQLTGCVDVYRQEREFFSWVIKTAFSDFESLGKNAIFYDKGFRTHKITGKDEAYSVLLHPA